MATGETPRITSRYLDSFTGKHVRIVGKVTELRGTEATIDSEGGVKVFLTQDSHLTPGNAVEVIGKVNQDLSIKVLKATDFGADFDYNAYRSLVDASHTVREVFYTPS